MDLPLIEEPEDYEPMLAALADLPEDEARAHMRNLARRDLYFLLRHVLKREDMDNPWLFERCREVQAEPDGRLDLWARDHYKSTIITFGLTILNILQSHGDDPLPQWNGREVTIGIFSHTRPIAKGFLRQIKREFEQNDLLKELFPDILFQTPWKEASKWSEDDGIVVKRKSNPKESTLEAWGLVDGQPTSKHFYIRVYDDVVTRESITTPEMIVKTTESLELSYNLGTKGGIQRFIGTRYHANDTYKTIIDRKTAIPRIYPATEDGSVEGEPVFLSREDLAQKRRDFGPYTFACQMLLNPFESGLQGFKRDWLKHYATPQTGKGMNIYLLVDPASKKRKKSDYTAIFAVGLATDGNYYVLDMLRDKMSLLERSEAVFRLHRKWSPLAVGYEEYGLQADVEHIEDQMERENYRFPIIRLGGSLGKEDRIRRLIPLFEQGRIWMPITAPYTDHEGIIRELVQVFRDEEYTTFPVSAHDDMLDCLARVTDTDLKAVFPKLATPTVKSHTLELIQDAYRKQKRRPGGGWMGA